MTWADSTYTDYHYDDGNGDVSYDSLGNRQFVNNNGTVTAYSTAGNSLNQYYSKGSDVYGYDDNGNLVTINTNECIYTYDSQNRLVSVVTTSPSHTYTYKYDVMGRRIEKNVDGTVTKYAYDGNQVIAEYDGSGTLLRKFIYGPGIDEPICMIIPAGQTNAGTYWYHFDALGSVVALSQYDSNDGYASIVERYRYSAFGKTEILTAANSPLPDSQYGNPYMFTGRRLDTETRIFNTPTQTVTDNGLYYYRARYYNPDLGRFLQPDPIGYSDGMNMYAYCGNNPLGFVDPMGLCGKESIDSLITDSLAGLMIPDFIGFSSSIIGSGLAMAEGLSTVLGGYALMGGGQLYMGIESSRALMPVAVESYNPARNQQQYDGKPIVSPVEYTPKQEQVHGSDNIIEFVKYMWDLSQEKPQEQKQELPPIYDPEVKVYMGGRRIVPGTYIYWDEQ